MQNFISKQKLLELADKADISFHKVGLQSYKFHSFLTPEENLELQQIEKVCLDNGRVDGISTVQEGLVIRNMMSDMDYTKDYKINRSIDNDRKTHIIYGFGCLNGQFARRIIIDINDSGKGMDILDGDHTYFHWFEPMIVLRRNDSVKFMFGGTGDYKIYGMTCEALGANVIG